MQLQLLHLLQRVLQRRRCHSVQPQQSQLQRHLDELQQQMMLTQHLGRQRLLHHQVGMPCPSLQGLKMRVWVLVWRTQV